MKLLYTFALLILFSTCVRAQYVVKGQVQDADGTAVAFANVALYADSNLVKVETTDDSGIFRMASVNDGTYDLVVSYLGAPDLRKEALSINEDVDLGVLSMAPAAVELAEATVTATRALVEVKPDRTVFNVQGTINAVGNDGLELLRKAPGVNVDNNDNISVLSRSGVLVYVDGKRLPLSGSDLSNYLRNLTAEQIDRIDIITNPGAKYEAEGNAGIIDIRLKKAENEGSNGSVSVSGSQGDYARYNLNANGNYRNKHFNAFGNLSYNDNNGYSTNIFDSYQNGLRLDEYSNSRFAFTSPSLRAGVDFYVSEKQTVGILYSGQFQDGNMINNNDVDIYNLTANGSAPDSLLRAETTRRLDRGQNTLNLNYRYDAGAGRSLNIDLDYGRYRNDNLADQANRYLNAARTPTSIFLNYFDTPTDIDIYTAKLDYEQPLGEGALSAGAKFSRVGTDNTFLYYDVESGQRSRDDRRSNQFDYDENVYAAYLNYAGSLGENWSYSAGLRAELTDAIGELTPFRNDLQEDPVELNYLSLFPTAGLTYQLKPGNTLNLNYGRRINRPDYNVLNPFRAQISQLSYERGNPFLNPEIVDNIELGYTHGYRYNFKLAYSQTANQITRLIGPDDIDPRAGFISWDNLATQTLYSFNASAPVQVSKKWNVYMNASASYLDNQADYGDGATIDLQAFIYSIFMQNTITLPLNFTGEISGYFAGPGVWGGVFKYNESGSLNLGLQRKFLNDQLNVKLSANDILFTSGFNGFSEFNGLRSKGRGQWDSRRVGLSLSYTFGNQKVKSRRRNTGLEDEAKRISAD